MTDRIRSQVVGNFPFWVSDIEGLNRENKLLKWARGTNIVPAIYVDAHNEAIICILPNKYYASSALNNNPFGLNHYARIFISSNPIF